MDAESFLGEYLSIVTSMSLLTSAVDFCKILCSFGVVQVDERATACPRPLFDGIPIGNKIVDLRLFAIFIFSNTSFLVDSSGGKIGGKFFSINFASLIK